MSDTLTVDQAVAEMTAPVEQAAPVEAPAVQAEEQEATPEAAAEATPETVEEEVSEDAEPEAADEPEVEGAEAARIDPPKRWDAEDKEWFATQPPEVQARILRQEEKREGALVKERTKVATEVRAEVDGERQQLGQIAASVRQYLPEIVARHKVYWGENGFDMVANVNQYGSDVALNMKAEYDAEVQNIQNLVQAQNLAEREGRIAYQRAQQQRLHEIRPEFADPKTAGPLKQELAQYLSSEGATADELEVIPAWGVSLALDGMKYRKAQAEAKAKAKTAPRPVAPAVKPTAAQASPSQERNITQLKQRLAKTGSIDDAVALQLAQDEARRRA